MDDKNREQNQDKPRLPQRSPDKTLEPQNDNDTMVSEANFVGLDPTDETIALFKMLFAEICDDPATIRFNKKDLGTTPSGSPVVSLQIEANAANIGALVGKDKKFFNGLMAIYRIIAQRGNQEAHLDKIREIPGGLKKIKPQFQPDPNWPKAKVEGLLQRLFDSLFQGQSKVLIGDLKNGGAAVDVYVGRDAKPHAVGFLQRHLPGIVAALCARNRQWPTTFRIIQDQMLYEQSKLAA